MGSWVRFVAYTARARTHTAFSAVLFERPYRACACQVGGGRRVDKDELLAHCDEGGDKCGAGEDV